MAIISCRRKNSSFYVSFSADTSIRYAVRLKSALSKIITEPAQTYHIDLSEIEDTDITFVQLLIAFNEKLKKQNRKMKLLKLPVGSRFISIVSECGIDVNSFFEIEDG